MRHEIVLKNQRRKMKSKYEKLGLIRRRPKSSEKLITKPEHLVNRGKSLIKCSCEPKKKKKNVPEVTPRLRPDNHSLRNLLIL